VFKRVKNIGRHWIDLLRSQFLFFILDACASFLAFHSSISIYLFQNNNLIDNLLEVHSNFVYNPNDSDSGCQKTANLGRLSRIFFYINLSWKCKKNPK
jgi:hypothetical protein